MSDRSPRRWLPREGETPPEALARLCRELRDAVGAERVSVWLYDAETCIVRPGTPGDPPSDHRFGLTLEEFEAAREVVDERRPVRIDDARTDVRVPGELADALELSSCDLVPLGEDPVVGVLAIEPADRGDSALEALLPFLTAAASQAIVWTESESTSRQTELLLTIMEEATSDESLDAVLGRICARLARELRVRRASIFLVEDGRFVPKMSRYADGVARQSEWESFVRADQSFALGDEVLRRGEPVVLDDVGPSPDWWAERFGVVSALGVPIGTPPDVIGVLVLDSRRRRAFSDEVTRLAGAVGVHLSALIDRGRTAEARDRHLQTVSAIRRLLEEGAGATSVLEAVDAMTRVVHEVFDTEQAVGYLRDDAGRITHVLPVDVPEEHVAILGTRLATEGADFFARLTAPGVVVVEDARASDLLPPDLVESLHLRSFLALPVLAARGPIGVITCVTTRVPRRWTESEIDLAEQLAIEGSLVVENAALREGERRRLAEMSHRAFHDPLTGLPNRSLLLDRITHAIARAERRPEAVAVLFVDLDRFKTVNDTLGHEAGDRILVEVARRLQDSVRPADTVARLAGDEFVVVLEDVTDRREAIRIAHRIHDEIERPFLHGGHELRLGASVGIALGVADGTDAEELVRRADRAMYAVKSDGGGDHALYEPERHDASGGRLLMEADLVGALERDELLVRYHPIVDMLSEHIAGVEALGRWEHPRLGLMGFSEFAGAAEQAGLLPEVGIRVVESAARGVAAWIEEGHSLDLHVNVSRHELLHRTFVADLTRSLEQAALPATRLVVEVSEASAVADTESTAGRLAELRALGVRIALDDFGSAQSSLRNLQELPVDILKIDPAFVDGVATEIGDAALVRAILDVAGTFGLDVIAEGVGTVEQRDTLVELGCRRGQGFYFGQPSDDERIGYLLERQKQAGSTPASSGGSGGRSSSTST